MQAEQLTVDLLTPHSVKRISIIFSEIGNLGCRVLTGRYQELDVCMIFHLAVLTNANLEKWFSEHIHLEFLTDYTPIDFRQRANEVKHFIF